MRTQDGTRRVLPSFIVFEGLDGSGTTTQANRLVEFLVRRGVDAEFTCEPTTFLSGAAIRKFLTGPEYAVPSSMAYLFAADRNEHLYRPDTGILALLDRGKTVVSDRYLFSSLAYQGQITDPALVEDLNSRFPLPEHLIYLELEPETADIRRSTRGAGDIYENLPFQQRVRRAYNDVLDRFRKTDVRIHRIDGSSDADTVFERIRASLDY